jgi:hypothetical protein
LFTEKYYSDKDDSDRTLSDMTIEKVYVRNIIKMGVDIILNKTLKVRKRLEIPFL